MKYNCIDCNYSTDDRCNWARHNKTKSHLKKVQAKLSNTKSVSSNNKLTVNRRLTGDYPTTEKSNANDDRLTINRPLTDNYPTTKKSTSSSTRSNNDQCIENDKFVCPYCNEKFSSGPSLSRHKNHRCFGKKDNNNSTNNLVDKSKEELEKKIMELEKDKEYLQSIAKGAITTAKKSVSALNYISQNFPNAPQLKPFEDYSAIEEYCGKQGVPVCVINLYRDKGLVKMLGEMIINNYIKSDPEDQSVWNSDAYRLNYVVRVSTGKKTLKWLPDKKGIELKERVINPLLSYVNKKVLDYMNIYKKNAIENILKGDIQKNSMDDLAVLTASTNLIEEIRSSVMSEQLVKFLAPHFHISRREIEAKRHPNLDSNEKFDEDSDCNPYSDDDSNASTNSDLE